jgi:hypothetical protein
MRQHRSEATPAHDSRRTIVLLRIALRSAIVLLRRRCAIARRALVILLSREVRHGGSAQDRTESRGQNGGSARRADG